MRICVVLVALFFVGCAHGRTVTPVGIKPRVIPGYCEDPPEPLPDGVIWVRRPCTLYAKRGN